MSDVRFFPEGQTGLSSGAADLLRQGSTRDNGSNLEWSGFDYADKLTTVHIRRQITSCQKLRQEVLDTLHSRSVVAPSSVSVGFDYYLL